MRPRARRPLPVELLGSLVREIAAQARRMRLPVDRVVYARAGRSAWAPILCVGDFRARLCVFGRDLGREEVLRGEPLVGAAGRLARSGLAQSVHRVFLANAVPYKPAGNRPYPARDREAFRPYVERLLGFVWRGDVVITLGHDAFAWFSRYAAAGAAAALWKRPDRYRAEMPCVLAASWRGCLASRPLVILPLPHPSPANVTGRAAFPALLRRRLDALRLA